MRKAGVVLGILVVLVVAGLVAAPYFLDLGPLKDQIAALVRARTGRVLVIDGAIQVRLLPVPTISARGLRLANPPGAAVPDMVRLRAVEVKLALAPLLTGHVEISSATLVAPELDLEQLPGGGNWRDIGRAAGPSGLMPEPWDVHRIAIEDGRVTLRSGADIERIEHVDARVALDSQDGPFTAEGGLTLRGRSLHFSASGGRGGGGGVPLSVVVGLQPDGRLEFNGTAAGTLASPHVSGKLTVEAQDAALLAASLAQVTLPPAFGQHLALAGTLDLASATATLDHAALDLGTGHAEGRLGLSWGDAPSFDIALGLDRLDLDHWLAAKTGPGSSAASSQSEPALAATAAIPLAAGASNAFNLPDRLRGKLALSIGAIVWRGDVVQQAQLRATLAQGRLTFDKLGGFLPGGVTLAASGTLALPGGTPDFTGHVSAQADNFRGFLGWLGFNVATVAPDRLRRAGLAGDVVLAGERLELNGIDMSLDASRFSGAAVLALRQRPGLGLRLVADRVNLDAYLPQEAVAPAPSAASSDGERPLGAFDANLDVTVGELTWRGEPLRKLHLDGLLQSGSLAVRALDVGDLGGATARISGSVAGLGGGPPTGQLAFDAQGPAFERLLRLLPPGAGLGQSFGGFTLSGSLQAGAGEFAVDGDLQLLGGHAHIAGDLGAGANRMNLGLDVTAPSFAQIVRNFSPGYRPQGGDPGAFRLTAQLTGGSGSYALGPLSLAIGQSTLDGRIGLVLGGARPKITADVSIGDWSLNRLLPARQTAFNTPLLPGVILAATGSPGAWSRLPLDVSWLGMADAEVNLGGKSLAYAGWRIDSPDLALSLADGTLRVGELGGTLFGGALAATGTVQSLPAPSLQLKLSLAGADLKAALHQAAGTDALAGRFDLAASLTGAGGTPQALAASLAGDAAVKAQDGTISGIDLAATAGQLDAPPDGTALMQAAKSGETRFSTLDGNFKIANGIARSDDLHLAADAGEGQSATMINLAEWTIDSRVEFRFATIPGAPPLSLRLEGPLNEPHETVELAALSQYLAQRVAGKADDASSPGPSSPRR